MTSRTRAGVGAGNCPRTLRADGAIQMSSDGTKISESFDCLSNLRSLFGISGSRSELLEIALDELHGRASEGRQRQPLGFGDSIAFPGGKVLMALTFAIVAIIDDSVNHVFLGAIDIDGFRWNSRTSIFI